MSAGSQSKETAENVRIGENLKYEMQSSFGYMDEVDLRFLPRLSQLNLVGSSRYFLLRWLLKVAASFKIMYKNLSRN